jgi:hypothetical protein
MSIWGLGVCGPDVGRTYLSADRRPRRSGCRRPGKVVAPHARIIDRAVAQ